MEWSVRAAQQDLRQAYANGAAGVLASALVWSIASVVQWQQGGVAAIWTLLIGGMFIHPAGLIIGRMFGASGQHQAGNPLAALAGSSTVWLILNCALAYFLSLYAPQGFFPAMLLTIAARYAVFATMFGNSRFWLLAGALAISGVASFFMAMPALAPALSGALLEAVFGLWLLAQYQQQKLTAALPRSAT